jgi:hypothetical protein
LRRPVAVVGEGPDGCGFGGEGGEGELRDLPVGVEVYFTADTAAFCVPVISYPYRLLLLIQNLVLSNISITWNFSAIRFMLLNIFPLIFFCLALTNIKAKWTYYLWHNLPLEVNPF